MKRLALIISLLLGGIPLSLSAAPLVGHHFSLKNSPYSENELKTLIHLEESGDLAENAIAAAQATLQELGIWKTLHVEKRDTSSGIVLEWTAEAFPLIREIHISGNYPILEKRIRQVLRLRIGDPYNPDKSEEDATKIRDLYEREGYFNTQVHVDPHIDSNGRVELTFKIRRGHTYRWGPIYCEGNQFYSCAVINHRLRDLAHFRPRRLKESLDKLVEKYKKKGFPNISIQVIDRLFDDARKRAIIFLLIDEGKRVSLSFEGNRYFTSRKLKEASGLLSRPGRNTKWQMATAKERLEESYREKGFTQVQVEPVKAEESTGQTEIEFKIQEGRQTSIKRILFPGRKRVSKSTLQDALLLKKSGVFSASYFDPAFLEEDRKRLETAYYNLGYRDARVGTPTLAYSPLGDRVTITIPIEEGVLYRLGNVRFSGNTVLNTAQLLKLSKLAPKKKATEEALLRAKDAILREYSKRGYPYTEIKFSETKAPSLLDLDIEISEGDQVTLDQILVQGNFRTRKSPILRAVNTETQAPLNLPRLLDGRFALRHFNSYQSIDLNVIGLRDKKDHTTALIKLEEKPELSNEIRIGYDTDRSFSGKYTLLKRSLFGTGQQLYLDLEGGVQLSRGALTHTIPRIQGRDWNIAETIFIERENAPDFKAIDSGAFVRGVRLFRPWLTFTIQPEIEHIIVQEIKTDALANRRPKENSTLGSLEGTMVIDRRDNFSNPGKGFVATVAAAYNHDLSDPTQSFVSNTYQFAVFQKLLPRVWLWNNLHFDRIWTLRSSAQVPAQKLFFLGGNDTVRGFDQDAINSAGGTLRFYTNTELQIGITPSLKLAGFLDSGSLTDSFAAIGTESFRHSAGPGLRYFTPIGPLRVDYGFILDRRPDDPRGRLHFSFGFIF